MPAKLTVHPPHRASRFLVIRDGESLIIGREPESGLVLEDPRVSKRHARLWWNGSGWSLEDLESKNGTSVNGAPALGRPLADGDWISLGGVMGRFAELSEEQLLALEHDRLARIDTTIGMRRRLRADMDPYDLLQRLLDSAMEVTRAERGFVLVTDPDGILRVEVAAGFDTEGLREPRFSGSLGAVARVLETGTSVVVSDAQADAFLGKRPSVVQKSLGVVACVPLRHDDRILGLLYVDGRQRSDGFTELDLDILEALGEHSAMVIAGLRLDRRIRKLFRKPGSSASVDSGLLDELQRRLSEIVKVGFAPPSVS